MTVPKLNLNLNEENELAFKISIEGSSSDIGATKPRFRLVVSEQDNGWGMVYPAEQGDDGNVIVRLPSTENFLEETNYRGKLEVILGNHYFVPTEVDIEFTRPLKVEAVVITNKSSTLREEKAQKEPVQTSVSVSTVEVRNRKGIKEASKPVEKPGSQSTNKSSNKSKKRTWEDLTEAEQQKVIAHLKEKKLRELKKQKLLEEKKNKAKKQADAKLEARFKDQLKDLMSSSLSDE